MIIQQTFFNFELFVFNPDLLDQKFSMLSSLAMIRKSDRQIIIRIECGESN
jgi:hypothetical protein